jgi:hypothetical protein
MAERQKHAVLAETLNPRQSERRRPGRTENISLELIPLFRGEAVAPPDDVDGPEDSLSPFLGIVIGVAICGLFWAAVLWVIL